MKKLRQRTTIIALSAFFALSCAYAVHAASARAAEPDYLRPGHFLNVINFFLDLDLTPEQKNDLQEIFSQTRDTVKPLIADMHELRSAMDETFLAEAIETEKASLQIAEMSRLKAEMTRAGLNALLQAAQVLTPEQRQTIINTRDEWKNRCSYWRNLFMKLFFD